MNKTPADAGIPLLTEVIPSPHPSNLQEAKVIAAAPVVPRKAEAAAPMQVQPNGEQWERLEQEIRERVLVQIMERIDFVLEQRVRDSLADVLQTAVEDLAGEIRIGLHNSIKDVVTRAVTHEITKLQSAKKQESA